MEIKEYSDVFDWEYDTEDVRFIPNMAQNYMYLNSQLSKGQLVDIIPVKIKELYLFGENLKK